jgi:predicted Fe-Mo cluster-binding NifX family protein
MTKIAIATNSDKLSGHLAHSPGHCKFFCIIAADKPPIFIENPAFTSENAFGQLAFEALNKQHVEIVIASFFGPRFSQLATNASIRLLSPPPEISTLDAIIQFINHNIMPNLNHKGPQGDGPQTGNKQGKCNPENKGLSDEAIKEKREMTKGKGENHGIGSGLGQGKGKGRGRGQGLGRKNRNA